MDLTKALQLLFCISLGILASSLFFMLTPWVVLATAAGALLLVVFLSRPELGLLAIVAIISSIISEGALPLIPIPIGSVHVTDLILLGLFFLVFKKLFIDKEFAFVRTPLDIPLLLFYIAVLISAFNAIMNYHLNFNVVFREFRGVSYYLIYFAVTNLIRDKRQIKFLINGLLAVGTVVGLAMVVQAIVGNSIQILPGRIESAMTWERLYSSTRILPPGQTAVYVAFVLGFCVLAYLGKSLAKSAYFMALVISGMGVLLTYNRSYWASIILTLSIFVLLTSKTTKRRVLAWSVIILILVGVLSFAFLSLGGRPREYFVSLSERFTSLFSGERVISSPSLRWRRVENEYALKQIVKHPLMGIGLANDYRPRIFQESLHNIDWNPLGYIHNGYLWVLISTGIIGFVPFIWFYLLFVIRGLKQWKTVEDDFLRSAVIAFSLSGIGILLMVIVNPMFMQWFSIVIIALMIGLSESIINLNKTAEKELHG